MIVKRSKLRDTEIESISILIYIAEGLILCCCDDSSVAEPRGRIVVYFDFELLIQMLSLL
jgi:hypothetical protein